MAEIQFSKGLREDVVPDIKVTRSPSGDTGTATFYFDSPKILSEEVTEEITGMYLIDEEGEIVSRQVNGKFVNGKPMAVEATLIMKSAAEWDRFIRFMERYGPEHGLGLSKS